MKCPKCNYLGFETGDRCRNCGYDFSLMVAPESPPSDLPPQPAGDETAPSTASAPPRRLEAADSVSRRTGAATAPALPSHPADMTTGPAAPHRADAMGAPALPLFSPGAAQGDDEPLIRVPAAPRPPLAVRRTPEARRLRPVSKPARQAEPEPVLEFARKPASTSAAPPAVSARPTVEWTRRHEAGSAGARLAALAVDHLILLAIDVGVIYFTLRIASLTMADWRTLPAAPLLAFLLMLKASYFCAFTAVGGQTIGKMAAHIRVVTMEGAPVDGARAVRRTLAAVVSALTCGLGFVPALWGAERLALHDRVARTRVIGRRTV